MIMQLQLLQNVSYINVLVELGTPYDSNDCTAHVRCENVS